MPPIPGLHQPGREMQLRPDEEVLRQTAASFRGGLQLPPRQRRLGMRAAIGATRKQLRMVMAGAGAIVGVIAATAGTLAGLAAWIGAAAGGV